MSDLYCVFGNPIAHSRSPAIHAEFARQTGQDMVYEARLAPVDGFAGAVSSFVAEGGRGANVTVPFKEDAYRLCTRLSPRAARAGAVNTLCFEGDEIHGDNTDGAGLLADISNNLDYPPTGKRVLLLGAGGAARGVVEPLLATQPAVLCIANRSLDKAQALVDLFADLAVSTPLTASTYAALDGQAFDLVINATSASLSGAALPLPPGLFAAGSLAYDMMYGKGETPFMQLAQAQGAARCADGLGMLVGQAAEAFAVWRGVYPDTAPVLASLRVTLKG
ncbi:MAG: shikimate dehydrogenase [Azonexus sp.]|nr:shikimate dehydrogenase [Azonexus sp.]